MFCDSCLLFLLTKSFYFTRFYCVLKNNIIFGTIQTFVRKYVFLKQTVVKVFVQSLEMHVFNFSISFLFAFFSIKKGLNCPFFVC